MRAYFGIAAALALLSVTARAQDDPPTRAGRLGYISGQVSIRPAGDSEWAAAAPNRPLTTGDAVWTDSNSRAEVQIGQTRLRLASGTEMDIENLDDHTIQVSVPQGTVTASVRHLDDGDANEIDTPNAAVGLSGAGVFRVDVSPDGSQSTVKVWSGSAKVTAAGSSFDVNEHQAATVNGTDAPTYDIADLGPEDSWDQWSDDRDHREGASESSRYVSADVAGYDDLDGNGDWRDDPTYGPVWTPSTVAADWVPYHYGHWVWEGPWGWTWVDDAPWGWAPFHYGRWVYAENHWGWCPGRVYEHPVFAPALVAFVGGRGWSAGVSFGGGVGVGWFPLAPEEPWYPSYHVSQTYVRNVNITNVTNINVVNVTNVNVTNINYRNRALPGAVTVVPDNRFQAGEPVARYAVKVPAAALVRAPLVGAAAPVVPTTRSIAPIAALHRPPAAVVNRPVVAVRQVPPRPVPFSEQSKLLAANPGRPVAPTQLATLKRPEPVNVRPATVAPRPGVTLKPARASVPAPKPPVPQPGRTGYVATTPSRPAPSQPRTVTPTPTRIPATPTRVPQPPAHPTISNAKPPSPSLSQSYTQQRNQMEVRHQQEAATPPAGVSPQQLATQHAQEHRQLDNSYVQARESGAKSMPPAPAPRPAPRAAAAPPPRPAAPARPAAPPARKH